MKHWYLGILILLVIPTTTADLDSKIAENCGKDFVPLISVSDPDKATSHPAKPDFYDKNLCITGIEDSEIDTSCEINSGFYISGKEEVSHFSIYEDYNLNVCTGDLNINVNKSCKESQETLFSVSDKYNGHIAQPSVFNLKGCGSLENPENVTLTASFNLSSSDSLYFDNQKLSSEKTFYPPAEFPYLISKNQKYLGGIVAPNFLRASRQVKEKNRIRVVRKSSESSFILPLTKASVSDVEDKKKPVRNKEFASSVRPSFGFYVPTEPQLKVRLEPETSIESNIDIPQGRYNMKLEKIGENRLKISVE